MALGYVLVESMRPGTRLDGMGFTLRTIERSPVRDPAPDQPSVWTVVEFEFPDEEAGRVADALAGVLDEHGGWYSNFSVNDETFVIYADRVFRYVSGDTAARAEAQDYGRSVGVPEHQLDWDEAEPPTA
jgi:hypothetical protein